MVCVAFICKIAYMAYGWQENRGECPEENGAQCGEAGEAVQTIAQVTRARPCCVVFSRGGVPGLLGTGNLWVPQAGWGAVEGHGTAGGTPRAPHGWSWAGSSGRRWGGPAGRPGCGVASRRRRGWGSPQAERPPSPAGSLSEPRLGGGPAGCTPRSPAAVPEPPLFPLAPVGEAAAGSVVAVAGAAGPGEAAPPPPGAPGGAFPSSRPPSPGSLSAPRQRRLPAPPAPLGEGGGGAPSYRRWEQSK